MRSSAFLTRTVLALFACLLIVPPWARAEVRLPSLFSDNMVLQAGGGLVAGGAPGHLEGFEIAHPGKGACAQG